MPGMDRFPAQASVIIPLLHLFLQALICFSGSLGQIQKNVGISLSSVKCLNNHIFVKSS